MNHLLPECDKPLAQIAATCAALKQLRPHCQPPDTVEKVRELVLDLVARGKLTDRELKTICPDGRFAFWFDDGDPFWGHSIEVRGSLAEGPTDASIAG